jgi:hypothetical protein
LRLSGLDYRVKYNLETMLAAAFEQLGMKKPDILM